MTSWATQYCLAGRMWPVGRRLESPALECETQLAVITHANTSNGIKIQTFFGKSWGMMLNLVQCPFNVKTIKWEPRNNLVLTQNRIQNLLHCQLHLSNILSTMLRGTMNASNIFIWFHDVINIFGLLCSDGLDNNRSIPFICTHNIGS